MCNTCQWRVLGRLGLPLCPWEAELMSELLKTPRMEIWSKRDVFWEHWTEIPTTLWSLGLRSKLLNVVFKALLHPRHFPLQPCFYYSSLLFIILCLYIFSVCPIPFRPKPFKHSNLHHLHLTSHTVTLVPWLILFIPQMLGPTSLSRESLLWLGQLHLLCLQWCPSVAKQITTNLAAWKNRSLLAHSFHGLGVYTALRSFFAPVWQSFNQSVSWAVTCI